MEILSRHWQKYRSIYFIYQGGKIDHGKHAPGPVSQSGAESEYNAACTAGMDLAHFKMFIHELLKKYPYIVPEEYPIVILYSKSAVCMAKNGNNTNHTRHIARILHFVRNSEKCKMHTIDWCVWYPYHSLLYI